MYSCPEGLDPRGATVIEKKLSREMGLKWNGRESTAHPMYDYRKVPTQKLKQRLDVMKFRDEGPLIEINLLPNEVRIPLNQHGGAPAESIVNEGQKVQKYDLIGKASGKVSINVHASIDGTVKKISKTEILIQSN